MLYRNSGLKKIGAGLKKQVSPTSLMSFSSFISPTPEFSSLLKEERAKIVHSDSEHSFISNVKARFTSNPHQNVQVQKESNDFLCSSGGKSNHFPNKSSKLRDSSAFKKALIKTKPCSLASFLCGKTLQ